LSKDEINENKNKEKKIRKTILFMLK